MFRPARKLPSSSPWRSHTIITTVWRYTGCGKYMWTKFGARVPHTAARRNVNIDTRPETFNLWTIVAAGTSSCVLARIVNSLVAPCVLPHRLTNNHGRDFLLHDLPALLEDVQLSELEYGTNMMALRHILALPCEMFSVAAIRSAGEVKENRLNGLHALLTWILCTFTCGDT
jgi:hypothetical protein